MLKRLNKRLFTAETFYKIITLLLAVGFWYYFEGLKRSDYNVNQFVQYQNIHPELTPSEGTTDSVKLMIKMFKKDLKTLNEDRDISLSVSLAQFTRPGTYKIGLSPKNFHSEKNIEIIQIIPSDVYVRLEKKYNKTVPVILNKINSIPEGLRIKSVKITPDKVTLQGPSSIIKELKKVYTAPLDVSQFTSSRKFQKDMPLRIKSSWIKVIGTKKVSAEMEIAERLIYKTFENIPVLVTSSDPDKKMFINPKNVTVQIEGPKSQMDITAEKDIYISIDVSNNETGFYPLKIKLPDGISLRQFNPEKVYVQVKRKKR